MGTDDPKKLKAMELQAKNLGRVIHSSLPSDVGFALLLFEFNASDEKPGWTTYLSNATRADMIFFLEDCLHRLRTAGEKPGVLSGPGA